MKENRVIISNLDLSDLKNFGLVILNGKADKNDCLKSFGSRGDKIILEKICIKNGSNSKVKPAKIIELTLATEIKIGDKVQAIRVINHLREGVIKKSYIPKTSQVIDLRKIKDKILIETQTSVYEVR